MSLVVAIGAAGGVGATTVAAHLAAALARKGRLGAAVDLCPDNALRLHFGMEWSDPAGFALQVLAGRQWAEGAYLSSGGVPFLPFGGTADDGEVAHFAAWLEGQPGGLAGCLDLIPQRPDQAVVADAPRMPWRLGRQALAGAQLALVVAAPDAPSYASLPGLLEAAAAAGAAETWVLLNGFDPTRSLDRDMALLLSHDFGLRSAPVAIHRDESVREALACKETVFDYAPASRAAYDFESLAVWVLARLGRQLGEGR